MPETFYSKSRLTRFLLLTALVVAVVTSAAYLMRPSFIVPTENRATDLVMALASVPPPSGAVFIVDIDEKSLARYGQWPWPRSLLAQLVGEIQGAGAAAIGLDMILAEPDRTTEANRQGSKSAGRGLRPPATAPDGDQSLAKTLANGHSVLGYEFLFEGGLPRRAPCNLHPPPIVWITSSHPTASFPRIYTAQGVVCNRPLLNEAVRYSGFLNAAPDQDGMLRRVPMLINFENHLYPSFDLALLMEYQGLGQLEIVRRGSDDSMTLRWGSRGIPLDGEGNMMVRFSPETDIPRAPAADVLRGKVPPEKLRNRVVLVGSTAAGLQPTYQTFAGKIHSHVDVQAEVLDGLLAGRPVIRTGSLLLTEVAVGALAAAGTALAVAWWGLVASALFCLAVLVATWLGMGLVFELGGYLFSPLLPTVLLALTYAALTIAKAWKLELAAREVAEQSLALLRERELHLSSIISAVPDIIFSLDRCCRVRYISPAVATYGLSPEALRGRPLLPFVRKGDRDAFVHGAEEVFRGGTVVVEFQAVRLKRRPIWFGTHMVPLRGEKEGGALLGVARDVTDRKIAEQALAEKQHQLQELNASLAERVARAVQDIRERDQILILQGRQAAMGEMISNIAHQWRQPLNTLGLIVQELLLTYDSSDFSREALEERIKKGMQLIMHMSKTIDAFRNYFREDKVAKVFSAREAVAKILSLVEPALKSLEIETELIAADECEIRGYPGEYAQVLLNILLNSRDAFENTGGGTKRRITITILRESGRSVVTFADNAGGIPEEVLPKIFDPYFTTKGPDRGTGIGLYMAKTIIEKNMGGRLTARNVASGAEFRIEV